MTTVGVLLAVGVVLLLLEVLLPGGVAGLAGLACLLVAVGLGYRVLGFEGGTWLLAGVVAGCSVGAWTWLRYFPESRIAARFISRTSVGELGLDHAGLVNATGTALTQLRPSGVALVAGRRVDVVAESALIPKGTPVRVVEVEGGRIVVRAEEPA